MGKKSACRFQIPLKYNDGRDVEPAIIVDFKSQLDRAFGGWTPLGIVEGSWGGQVEPTLYVEVRVFKKDIPRLRQMVVEIATRLGQKQIDFDAPEPSIESINLEEEGQADSNPDEAKGEADADKEEEEY